MEEHSRQPVPNNEPQETHELFEVNPYPTTQPVHVKAFKQVVH